MEQKTTIAARDGELDLVITRSFELSAEQLFSAFIDAELFGEWMNTTVLEWEPSRLGHYRIRTLDPKGNPAFEAHGVIHDLIPNQSLTRTFEMANTGLGVQLELYRFEVIDDHHCALHMHVVYESSEQRDRVMRMGYSNGLLLAHNRIQQLFTDPSTTP